MAEMKGSDRLASTSTTIGVRWSLAWLNTTRGLSF